MTTATIAVTKNGATRSVTVLASRLIALEIALTVVVFAAGVVVGKFL